MAKNGRCFLFGGLIGAIIALLFSPKNGKEVRNSILENTKEFVNNPEEFKQDLKYKIKSLLNRLGSQEDIVYPEDEIIISKDFKEGEND